MQNVQLRLEAWRDAERRRDALALGSSEWQEAEEDARSAAKAFRAGRAQALARHAEEEFSDRHSSSAQVDRRISRASDLVAGAFLALGPQR